MLYGFPCFCCDLLTYEQKIIWYKEITVIDRKNPKNHLETTYGAFLGYDFPKIITQEKAIKMIQKIKPDELQELKEQVRLNDIFASRFEAVFHTRL